MRATRSRACRWQAWGDAGGNGPYPDVSVHNHAIDLGLVIEAV